jgi:hypothetical protein
MTHEIEFYGKKISEMNEQEKLLYILDTQMTKLFDKVCKTFNPIELIILNTYCDIISQKRVETVSEILNIKLEDFDNFKELLDYVETTQYGYQKYIIDSKKYGTEINVSELVSDICLN